MKIVTWNCNGAFRKKFEELLIYDADIYIIQECENPKEAKHRAYQKFAENYLWIGDSKNKGIGVFCSDKLKLEKLEWSDIYKGHKVKHFLPCRINDSFDLLAVWTHSNKSPTFGYIGQLWKCLQVNRTNLGNSLVIGDLNSNKIWDKWDRWWNHSDVVRELSEIGIKSLYHLYFGEKQGEETKPTLYLQRNINKPYHVDYVFGSGTFNQSVKKVVIGEKNKWLQLSDHLPIICEFK